VACPAAARDLAAYQLADPMGDIAEIPVRFILFHVTAAHLKLLALDVDHNAVAPCAVTQAATMPP